MTYYIDSNFSRRLLFPKVGDKVYHVWVNLANRRRLECATVIKMHSVTMDIKHRDDSVERVPIFAPILTRWIPDKKLAVQIALQHHQDELRRFRRRVRESKATVKWLKGKLS